MAQGKILDIRSKWVGDSQVHITVRKIANKLVVDLIEFSPEGTEVVRAKLNALAVSGAVFFGSSGSDFCVIRDYVTHRKLSRGDGSMVGISIRERSYVFNGFPESEGFPA